MSVSWRDKSIAFISGKYLEYEVQATSLGQAIAPKDARKYVNDHYPFGARQWMPYKVWCEELRYLVSAVAQGIPAKSYEGWRRSFDQATARRRNQERKAAKNGQISFLEVQQ